jgi:hypothetical protein
MSTSNETTERERFEVAMNDIRFLPRELNFSRARSPSGRDEYANSHLESCWVGWQARASLPQMGGETFQLPDGTCKRWCGDGECKDACASPSAPEMQASNSAACANLSIPAPKIDTSGERDAVAVMCGGCGNADPEKRCIGCAHVFTRSREA